MDLSRLSRLTMLSTVGEVAEAIRTSQLTVWAVALFEVVVGEAVVGVIPLLLLT